MDGVMARWLFIAAFLMLMLAFRALGAWQGWMNFSPLPAFLLMSLVCFTGRERWVLPVLAWLVSGIEGQKHLGQKKVGWV